MSKNSSVPASPQQIDEISEDVGAQSALNGRRQRSLDFRRCCSIEAERQLILVVGLDPSP